VNYLLRLGLLGSGLLSAVTFIASIYKAGGLKVLTPAPGTALVYHFSLYLPDNRNSFFDGIIRGAQRATAELDSASILILLVSLDHFTGEEIRWQENIKQEYMREKMRNMKMEGLLRHMEFKLDYDEAILDTRVPVSILQPLVENRVIHAFKDGDETARRVTVQIIRIDPEREPCLAF
jgi:hypothetical protein